MKQMPGRLVLLGRPVDHSLSPAIQNAALRAAAVPLTYEALDVTPVRLAATLQSLVGERAAGNVTVPHKEAAFRMCATLTEEARRVGAVNCFRVERGALAGHNTDTEGFSAAALELLRGNLPARIALIGAGGAARAVATVAELWSGCQLTVFNRSPQRAERFAQRFDTARIATSLEDALRASELVVNATPTGIHDDCFPTPIELLPRGAAVMDLAYRRGETPWVRAARAAGHPACDGLPMLLAQAAESFRYWLETEPDRAAMARAAA